MRDEREEKIYQICETGIKFKAQAFFFIYMVLGRCRLVDEQRGHVTGQELLAAFSAEAKSQYGPMALTVLNHMGITATLDVGELVFLMVDNGLLSRTEKDTLDDFKDVFDFEQEFVTNYDW